VRIFEGENDDLKERGIYQNWSAHRKNKEVDGVGKEEIFAPNFPSTFSSLTLSEKGEDVLSSLPLLL
jgi:hypothetical protein